MQQRIVASVTWGKCPTADNRPHLGELIIFEGPEADCESVMRQDNPALWKVRQFLCRFCRSHIRLIPTAILIVDVPEV